MSCVLLQPLQGRGSHEQHTGFSREQCGISVRRQPLSVTGYVLFLKQRALTTAHAPDFPPTTRANVHRHLKPIGDTQ